MKVLYILHTSAPNDGSSKAFLSLLNCLAKQDISPLVICPTPNGIYNKLVERKIPVIALRYNYRPAVYPWSDTIQEKCLFIPRLFGRWMVNTCAILQLLRIAKQFKPDVIHTNSSVCSIGYHVSRLLRIKHVWHIREYGALDFHYYYYPWRNWQLRRYQKRDSYTLCITKDIQRYNHLEHHKNSAVIYDGVLSVSCAKYQAQKSPYILFVGYISRAKGVLPLLQAYKKYLSICTHPLPLKLVGGIPEEGAYIDEVMEFVHTHHLKESVSFLGMRNDVLQLDGEAQALIVPSLSEGFGFITAEAMFSGCLVVGHDVAGTKEQFDNGKQLTGEEIGLRYTTQEQLVQHLIDITTTAHNGTFSEIYEPMILRGQQVVKQLYSTERNAEQIYQFYQQILKHTDLR